MCRTLLRRRARRASSGASGDAPRWAASTRSQGSVSAVSTTSSSGQTIRSAIHGSVSGSIPDAAATASPTSLRGDGKSTFAQTPSAPSTLVPSRVERRCVSQRSIPRVGTATTSRANGSSGGSASNVASASTSPSARSARWMCSTLRRDSSAARIALHRALSRSKAPVQPAARRRASACPGRGAPAARANRASSTGRDSRGLAGSTSGRRSAKERRDVDVVVADLERRALAIVDPRTAVA